MPCPRLALAPKSPVNRFATATPEPALALLEIASIARAAVVLDALTKQAHVRILRSQPVTPGKFLILFAGQEGSVEEAFNKGRERADVSLIDHLYLPDAEARLVPAVSGVEVELVADEALLINEYVTVSAALRALDHALKAAQVSCKKLKLAQGIGGKAYFVLGGELPDVQAAAGAAAQAVRAELCVASEQIARLSPEVRLAHV